MYVGGKQGRERRASRIWFKEGLGLVDLRKTSNNFSSEGANQSKFLNERETNMNERSETNLLVFGERLELCRVFLILLQTHKTQRQ